MLIAIRESEYAYNDGHMCVAKPSEEACIDWVIDKDFDFWGNGKNPYKTIVSYSIDDTELFCKALLSLICKKFLSHNFSIEYLRLDCTRKYGWHSSMRR